MIRRAIIILVSISLFVDNFAFADELKAPGLYIVESRGKKCVIRAWSEYDSSENSELSLVNASFFISRLKPFVETEQIKTKKAHKGEEVVDIIQKVRAEAAKAKSLKKDDYHISKEEFGLLSIGEAYNIELQLLVYHKAIDSIPATASEHERAVRMSFYFRAQHKKVDRRVAKKIYEKTKAMFKNSQDPNLYGVVTSGTYKSYKRFKDQLLAKVRAVKDPASFKTWLERHWLININAASSINVLDDYTTNKLREMATAIYNSM